MKISAERLKEIIASHGKWLRDEGGQRADLRGANLQDANLRGANLQDANLRGANLQDANLRGANLQDTDLQDANLQGAYLRGANLRGAYLQDADLRGAYLRGAYLQDADLRGAYLRGANLRGANLRGANLPNGIYQIGGAGSNNRCTTFDSVNDCIICGCWNDNNGNHLEAFKQRIIEIYGENGKTPNAAYFAEYMAAVTFFEAVKGVKK